MTPTTAGNWLLRYILVMLSLFPAIAAEPAQGTPLLVLNRGGGAPDLPLIDLKYKADLEREGFAVTVLNLDQKLSAEYLRQFAVVILSGLPWSGSVYTVAGYLQRDIPGNLELLKHYVSSGGGLLLMPGMYEFGEAYGKGYNEFLKPYHAQLLVQQVRDDASSGETPYAQGRILPGHPITNNIDNSQILYPVGVMRWDHAYSTTPVLCDKEWTILAQAGKEAGTHIALDNKSVGVKLSDNRNLFAVRAADKGLLAVSGICTYYTLSAVYWPEKEIGENTTGIIKGAVMSGEEGGRSSAYGRLIANTLRELAKNSVQNGIGTVAGVTLPVAEAFPESEALIDWTKRPFPPTWAHRVIPCGVWPNKTYDELPDPTIPGEMKHWKILVGPRTGSGGGSGTVAEYRKAAQEAGYSAIAFANIFEEMTADSWTQFVKECQENSDAAFVALPGMEIESYTGEHYLVLGAERWPDPTWLTPDRKRLHALRMLSLGWFGHLAVAHRPGSSPLAGRYWKQATGVSVATYDTTGKLIDDGMYTYQWQVASDSNPTPVAVHEVLKPDDVKLAASKGLQQIMPAPTLPAAVNYFRYGFSHGFDDPQRYYLSEGPVVTGWSILNKDKGKRELNRDRFRVGLGVTSQDPLQEVVLFDGFSLANRWLPGKPELAETIDGRHETQHEYFMVATDTKGRRAITSSIRTAPGNWRLRCSDHQNWLGSPWIYTGWSLNRLPGFDIGLENTREGLPGEKNRGVIDHVPPMFEYKFFSDHVQIAEAHFDAKVFYVAQRELAGDGKGSAPQRPTEVVEATLRYTLFRPGKSKDFDVMLYEAEIRLKQDAVLSERELNPILGHAMKQTGNLLILPGKEPQELYANKDKKGGVIRKAPSFAFPAGSYADGMIALSDGLTFANGAIGLPMSDSRNIPSGTIYTARYLLLDNEPFWWKRSKDWAKSSVDDKALRALSEMGFRGTPPYSIKLRQGTLKCLQYIAECTSQNGGISGTICNPDNKPLLAYVPLVIRGLNQNIPSALWRSDLDYLEFFGMYYGVGYVPFNADSTVDFYAGNIATCDPRLVVSVREWSKEQAIFTVHNPTKNEITSEFSTAAGFKGYKQIKTNLSVKAGTSIVVTEQL